MVHNVGTSASHGINLHPIAESAEAENTLNEEFTFFLSGLVEEVCRSVDTLALPYSIDSIHNVCLELLLERGSNDWWDVERFVNPALEALMDS